jgi:hypothetical protein
MAIARNGRPYHEAPQPSSGVPAALLASAVRLKEDAWTAAHRCDRATEPCGRALDAAVVMSCLSAALLAMTLLPRWAALAQDAGDGSYNGAEPDNNVDIEPSVSL